MGRTRTATDVRLDFDSIADPDAADPLLVLAAAEESEATSSSKDWNPPPVVFTLGLSLVWPPAPSVPCPACHGRALPFTTYCLVCHRSGCDHLLGKPRLVPVARVRRRDGLRGGVGA